MNKTNTLMRKIVFSLLLTLFFLPAIAQKIYPDMVLVCDAGETLPPNSEYIGQIELGSVLNAYGYDKAIEEAKQRTADNGGNIFRLDNIVTLNDGLLESQAGIKLEGSIYYNDNIEFYLASKYGRDTITRKMLKDTAHYAMLYVYQPSNREGIKLPFRFKINSREMCSIAEDSCIMIRLNKEGEVTLSSANKKGTERELNIQFGKAYFIRCDIQKSDIGRKYSISVTSPNPGYHEFMDACKR
jgi:hypothetical protein